MGIIKFFRLPRHRIFSYEPIYYDERKEELEKKIKNIEAEIKAEANNANVSRLKKGQLNRYFKEVKRKKVQSNTRLVIILLALILLSYIIFIR
jgi:hypothetical protein